MKDTTTTVRAPADLRRQLRKLSESGARPVSDLVRESIQRYVSIQQFRALRTSVIPVAEAAGPLSDQDVFDGIS